MVRLFVENREVDLADSIDYTINKQFTDVSNPTDIINDWSKTIVIPRTNNNEKIFGDLYNPQRAILSGANNVGLYFDPYKKFNFRLQDGESTIMVGYGKVNSCTSNGIDVTLNGELGKIIQELKKLTFNSKEYTDESDKKYYIDTNTYVNGIINKEFIYNDFTTGKDYTDLIDSNGNVCDIHKIIGFLPNNAYMDGFDYKTMEFKNGNTTYTRTFADILNNLSDYTSKTGTDGDTTLPNGITSRGIGEYRSYLQQPFIFYNKIFQIVEAACKKITNYTFEYDTNWFNSNNPYWSKLSMLLNPIGLSKGIQGVEINKPYTMGLNIYKLTENTTGYTYSTNPTVEQYMILNNYQGDENKNYLTEGTVQFIMNIQTTKNLESLHLQYNSRTGNIYTTLHLYIAAYDYNTNKEIDRIDYTVTPSECITAPKEDTYNKKFSTLDLLNTYKTFTYDFPFKFKFTPQPYGNIGFKLGAYFDNTTPFQCEDVTYCFPMVRIGIKLPQCKITDFVNTSQSYSRFNLEGMWDANTKPFDKILEYCKMFKILIKVDSFNKKIKFIPQDRFFSNYKIENWTNKVAHNKEIKVSPNFADNRYLLLGYGENSNKYGEIYKKNNSVEYGALKLNTNYQFNSETKNEFDKIPATIDCSENILSWCDLYDSKKIIYRMPQETTLALADEDNKYKENFGGLFFYCDTQRVDGYDGSNQFRLVYISDDTKQMFNNQTFMYGGELTNKVITFPKASTTYGCYASTFAIPMENYTYDSTRFNKADGIYNFIWKNYMNELYNIQNKKIECYIQLDNLDFQNFDFNHFVKIGEQLYLVNKIIDFNPTNNEPTKCELISITDLNNYTTNNFNYLYFVGRFAAVSVISSAGDVTNTISLICYNPNSIYASIKPMPTNTQIYLGGIKMGSKVQKLNISNNTLSYAIKNPTKGESTTITYYADKDGKLPLNTTIINCI